MYLMVIMYLFHRKVVGWSMNKNLGTAETIILAWKMAVMSSDITDRLISHSDRGSQYVSYEFPDILKSIMVQWYNQWAEKGIVGKMR